MIFWEVVRQGTCCKLVAYLFCRAHIPEYLGIHHKQTLPQTKQSGTCSSNTLCSSGDLELQYFLSNKPAIQVKHQTLQNWFLPANIRGHCHFLNFFLFVTIRFLFHPKQSPQTHILIQCGLKCTVAGLEKLVQCILGSPWVIVLQQSFNAITTMCFQVLSYMHTLLLLVSWVSLTFPTRGVHKQAAKLIPSLI